MKSIFSQEKAADNDLKVRTGLPPRGSLRFLELLLHYFLEYFPYEAMTPGSWGSAWPPGGHQSQRAAFVWGSYEVNGEELRLAMGSVPKLWGCAVQGGVGAAHRHKLASFRGQD